MKFKEIKPDMAIHCSTEEDAKALLKHLYDLGFSWYGKPEEKEKMTAWECENGEGMYYTIDTEYGIRWSSTVIKADEIITEYFDLIEPEANLANDLDNKLVNKMNAEEILEWLAEADDEILYTVFGYDNIPELMMDVSAAQVVKGITAYEAAKKAPKPMEVEYGKSLYVSVRNEETGLYQGYSSFEYWPDERVESYETIKTTFLSEVARETQKTVRIIDYDICRVKDNES